MLLIIKNKKTAIIKNKTDYFVKFDNYSIKNSKILILFSQKLLLIIRNKFWQIFSFQKRKKNETNFSFSHISRVFFWLILINFD